MANLAALLPGKAVLFPTEVPRATAEQMAGAKLFQLRDGTLAPAAGPYTLPPPGDAP